MLNVLQNLQWDRLLELVLTVIPVLLSITIHECCHGLSALALGDTTARDAGRLSLNPLKHFDPIGFLMLVTVHFGWAKPVPVDMRRFQNPKAGMALTALAGPASNVVLAALMLFLYGLMAPLAESDAFYYVAVTFYLTARVSASFAVFNIIPLPPLDGSKVLFSFLPPAWYGQLMRYERYGMLLLVVLVYAGILSGPLNLLAGGLMNLLAPLQRAGIALTTFLMG